MTRSTTSSSATSGTSVDPIPSLALLHGRAESQQTQLYDCSHEVDIQPLADQLYRLPAPVSLLVAQLEGQKRKTKAKILSTQAKRDLQELASLGHVACDWIQAMIVGGEEEPERCANAGGLGLWFGTMPVWPWQQIHQGHVLYVASFLASVVLTLEVAVLCVQVAEKDMSS
jgi:hypothetical protein